MNKLSRKEFFERWRKQIQSKLPEFQELAAQAGILGVVAASSAILVNDPTLTAGVITGLAGNFMSNAVERWRTARDAQEPEALFQEILAELQSVRAESDLQEAMRELNLAQLANEYNYLSDKVVQLNELVQAGFATQEQVRAINTDGGPYIEGDANIQGDYTQGDYIEGDKFEGNKIVHNDNSIRNIYLSNNVRRGKHRPRQARIDNFVGREEELDYLADFSRQQDPGYLLLQAPPGFGKTWLIGKLAGTLQSPTTLRAPKLLHYDLNDSADRRTVEHFLQALNEQLLSLLESSEQLASARTQLHDQFDHLWNRARDKANEQEPLLLIIDGLDRQAQNGKTIADVLPQLSPYVHIIVTSRLAHTRERDRLQHPFFTAKVLELGPFYVHDVRTLMKYYGLLGSTDQDTEALQTDQVVWLHWATRGIPLFAHALCKADIQKKLKPYFKLEDVELPEIESYLGEELDDLWAATQEQQTRELLGVLAVAYDGLTHQDLAQILKISERQVRNALTPVERYLLTEDPLRFWHPRFHRLVREEFRHEEPRYTNLLLEWCKSYQNRNWPDNTPTYILLHFARHLDESQDKEAIYQLLDRRWIDLKLRDRPETRRSKTQASLVKDLKLIIDRAAAASPPDWIPLLRCCVLYANWISRSEQEEEHYGGWDKMVYWELLSRIRGYAELIPNLHNWGNIYDRLSKLFDALVNIGDFTTALEVAEQYVQVCSQLKYSAVLPTVQPVAQACRNIQQRANMIYYAQGVLRWAKLAELKRAEKIGQQIKGYDIRDWTRLKVAEEIKRQGEHGQKIAHEIARSIFENSADSTVLIDDRYILERAKEKFAVIGNARRTQQNDSFMLMPQPLPTRLEPDAESLSARIPSKARDHWELREAEARERERQAAWEREREAERQQWQNSAYVAKQIGRDFNFMHYLDSAEIVESLLKAGNKEEILRVLEKVAVMDDDKKQAGMVGFVVNTLVKRSEVDLAHQFLQLIRDNYFQDRRLWQSITSAAIRSKKHEILGKIVDDVWSTVELSTRVRLLSEIADAFHECGYVNEAGKIIEIALELDNFGSRKREYGTKRAFHRSMLYIWVQLGELDKAWSLATAPKVNLDYDDVITYLDWLGAIVTVAIQDSRNDLLPKIRTLLESEFSVPENWYGGNLSADDRRREKESIIHERDLLIARITGQDKTDNSSSKDGTGKSEQKFQPSTLARLRQVVRPGQSEWLGSYEGALRNSTPAARSKPDFYARLYDKEWTRDPGIEEFMQSKPMIDLLKDVDKNLKDLEPLWAGVPLGMSLMKMIERGDTEKWQELLVAADKHGYDTLTQAGYIIALTLAKEGQFDQAVELVTQIARDPGVFSEVCYYLLHAPSTNETMAKIANALKLACCFGRDYLFAVLNASTLLFMEMYGTEMFWKLYQTIEETETWRPSTRTLETLRINLESLKVEIKHNVRPVG